MIGVELEGKNIRILELTNGRYRKIKGYDWERIQELADICEGVEVKLMGSGIVNIYAYGCKINRITE